MAARLDEVEQVNWRGTGINWRPIRRALGVDIVGMSGYTADRAGQFVVEPHTEVEDGRGHQEVYVVLRGSARFVIDGVEVEAPAGTLVRVDPHARREAIAIEPDTAVLALGGESSFEPSASEWIERARPHIRDEPSVAGEIIENLRRERPGDGGIEVGRALLAVGQGNDAEARRIVRELIDELPGVREVLERDPDLRAFLPG